MTKKEFLARLRKIKGWTLADGEAGGEIRLRGCVCPLVAVARERIKFVEKTNKVCLGHLLAIGGIDGDDAGDFLCMANTGAIMRAADSWSRELKGKELSLRRELLKACGLKEPSGVVPRND